MKEVKSPKKPLIYYYGVVLLVLLVFNLVITPLLLKQEVTEVDYGTFMSMTESKNIGQVQVEDQQIVFTDKDEKNVYQTNVMDDPNLTERLYESGAKFSKDVDASTSPLLSLLITGLLPMLIFIGLGQYMAKKLREQMGGKDSLMFGGMGKSNAKIYVQSTKGIRFDDVAGEDEAKESLAEIVDYLHNPQKYTDVGASMPKGVLLVGPPGTGKTMLAKAVAGEANVPFFSISGSEFVEMFVGMGASKVRDLFKQAKEKAPCIVFIDEIDAIGKKRDNQLSSNDEREQTLNQLLTEMDGFDDNNGVIILAATNRPESLDPALTRPGRFDRRVPVELPDLVGREAILKVHAKDKPLADNVNLEALAKATAGFTGADLANLLNEAALLAAGKSRAVITMKDLEEAMIKVIAGPEKRSRVVSQYERKLTAFHEAGHAIAMYCLPTQDPVHMITIVPRGMAGGMTISLPQDDQSFVSKSEMFETIVGFLGGRVAEQLKLDDISTGASNDIQRATAIARDMVSKYAMSDKLGPVCYSSGNEVFIGRDYEKTKSYSESVAGRIDDEVQTILMQAYDKCTELLKAHDAQLDAVAAYLMAHNNMGRAQFEAVMEGKPVPDADVLPITSVEAIEEEPHPSEEE